MERADAELYLASVKLSADAIDVFMKSVWLGPSPHASPTGVHRDVALLGIGALLPSGAASPQMARNLVLCGSDAIVVVPATRWDVDAQPSLGDAVDSRVRFGSFMAGVELVDNTAFGVGPVETAAMDPQQRLLLEYGYSALHSTGFDRSQLVGSPTGVFLGIATTDFSLVLAASPAGESVYAATGGALSIASGRISFALGLHGPCVSIDTACCAALVAGHSVCGRCSSASAPRP
jgi:acyl transferase domain-containing protein